MKTRHLLLISSVLPLLTACGGGSKQNPVSDLETLRGNARAEIARGPEQVQVITKEIVVERDVEVVRNQGTVGDHSIVISSDMNVRFVEGQSGSFKIRAMATVPGVKTRLVAKNIPDGARLEATSEANVYAVTWKPALGSVPAQEAVKPVTMKFALEIVEAPSAKIKSSLEGLVREKEVIGLVLHDQTPPSDLKITGLPDEVRENTETRFEVSVRVPGIDEKSGLKPELRLTYDGAVMGAGNQYREMDATRHIVADPAKTEVEYVGDSTWRFAMIFDTKNNAVQTEIGADGKAVANAAATHVRMNLKVFSPFGAATPNVLKQLKIVREIPAVPAAPAQGATP